LSKISMALAPVNPQAWHLPALHPWQSRAPLANRRGRRGALALHHRQEWRRVAAITISAGCSRRSFRQLRTLLVAHGDGGDLCTQERVQMEEDQSWKWWDEERLEAEAGEEEFAWQQFLYEESLAENEAEKGSWHASTQQPLEREREEWIWTAPEREQRWRGDEAERFHLVPNAKWDQSVRDLVCGARNSIDWCGGEPVPEPPEPQSCWILPASDEGAIQIARYRAELHAAGWKVVTSPPELLEQFANKHLFFELARHLRLTRYLPRRFKSPSQATYPCILKRVRGEYGKGIFIVDNIEQVMEATDGANVDETFVLQELISGSVEYSTSLLLKRGNILDDMTMRYIYNEEEYIWPRVEEIGRDLIETSERHLAVMTKFLDGYSGICNFNYKLRPSGSLCIFEVNPRVG